VRLVDDTISLHRYARVNIRWFNKSNSASIMYRGFIYYTLEQWISLDRATSSSLFLSFLQSGPFQLLRCDDHLLENAFLVWQIYCSWQWRTQNIFIGGFIQWHMGVICIWCPLFVTSQFDVIFMFPNQRFDEVCWHNMHIPLQALPLCYVSLHWM